MMISLSSYAIVKCEGNQGYFAVFRSPGMWINRAFQPINGIYKPLKIQLDGYTEKRSQIEKLHQGAGSNPSIQMRPSQKDGLFLSTNYTD
jgi:hypothetical protein